MKGKVTLFFLIVFAAVQIYFARHPITHQVVGSSWIEVSRHAGTLVEREQRYYLVSNRRVYELRANSVHVAATPLKVAWEEIPQPTGHGIWRVAYTRQGFPVGGIGGSTFPSTDGTQVIWKDPASGALYESRGLGGGLNPFATGLRQISRILWAPDGAAVALEAKGREGAGIYVFDGDHYATAVIPPAKLLDFGFTREETVLAALSHGTVLWQGHRDLVLPEMRPVYVDNGVASIWGIHGHSTVLWKDGRTELRHLPAIQMWGAAKFSQNGSDVAILARNPQGKGELYLDGMEHQWALRLPYDIPTGNYHLEGFLGNRWVIITISSGKDRGTYAWWVNQL